MIYIGMVRKVLSQGTRNTCVIYEGSMFNSPKVIANVKFGYSFTKEGQGHKCWLQVLSQETPVPNMKAQCFTPQKL